MREGPFAGPMDKARFEREVRILAQLNHPNIVTIHDSGVVNGNHYFVMGFIEGQSLRDYIASQRAAQNITADNKELPPRFVDHALEIFAKICEAVSAAHEQGIVHRDLKPGNIRVDPQGEPHILDFGLARTASGEFAGGTQDLTVTLSGHFLGSLAWASPEQARGTSNTVDLRSDVYSLGVILYQILTDRLPYDVLGPIHDVLARIVWEEPTPPSSFIGHLNNDIETIILKCLSKDPIRRYLTAAYLARDVRHYLKGEPIEAKRDSFAYVLRKRSIAQLQRYRISAFVMVVVAAALTYCVAGKVVYEWTHMHRRYLHFMFAHFSPTTFGPTLENVRVIAITDQTNPEALANREGLTDVTPQNWKSVRRLHGRLLEKLARSGARAVVSDIGFSTESEFDQDIVRGVIALRDKGIRTTIVVRTWWADGNGLPALSKPIARVAGWGCSISGFQAKSPWALNLLMQRGQAEPLPSLGLAAYATAFHTDAEVTYAFEPSTSMAHLLYHKSDPEVPQAIERLLDEEMSYVRVSYARPEPSDDAKLGIKADDMTGYLVMDMAPNSVLSQSTIEYGAALSADDAAMRQMFSGKIVMLGNLRTDADDRHPHPDGRKDIPGVYGHAVGLDTLFRRAAFLQSSTLGDWSLKVMSAFAAILGCLATVLIPNRSIARRSVLIGLTLIGLVATLVAFRQFNQLYNPLVPLFALIVSSELAAILQRIQGSPGR
jgi:serine/threonine protein kinase